MAEKRFTIELTAYDPSEVPTLSAELIEDYIVGVLLENNYGIVWVEAKERVS